MQLRHGQWPIDSRQRRADYGIEKHIRFRHRVKRAAWSTPEARWTVEAGAN